MAQLLLCPAYIESAAAASSSAAAAVSTYSAPAVAVAAIFTAPHQHLEYVSEITNM